jgi:hypothetical protein
MSYREARFPQAGGAPHYESFFVKGVHPSEQRAFWLRHTIHQRPGAQPTASLWLTLFDAAADEPVRAGKQTVAADGLSVPPGALVRIDGATLSEQRATGSLGSPTLDAAWDLTFETSQDELRHLPADWMYEGRIPRTKSTTPWPAVRFGGTMAGWDLAGWTGLVSHNWGLEHAHRWIWTHCGRFEGHGDDTWIEAVLGRIRLGGWTVPWLGNGVLSLDGERFRLGGPRRARSTKVDETPTGARFLLTGAGIRVEAEVRARPEHMVVWRYSDPAGPEHHSAHSSIADYTLRVRVDGRAPLVLYGRGSGSYELGMHETDHGLPVQQYPDGELHP